jgi:ATP synthase protein I
MADEQRPPSFEDFDARLRRAREADPGPRRSAQDEQPQRLRWGSGLQVGVELLAGILGGLLLGYGLDAWLGTLPLFIVVFFLLGAAAGTLNAYRHLRRMQNEAGGPQGP